MVEIESERRQYTFCIDRKHSKIFIIDTHIVIFTYVSGQIVSYYPPIKVWSFREYQGTSYCLFYMPAVFHKPVLNSGPWRSKILWT